MMLQCMLITCPPAQLRAALEAQPQRIVYLTFSRIAAIGTSQCLAFGTLIEQSRRLETTTQLRRIHRLLDMLTNGCTTCRTMGMSVQQLLLARVRRTGAIVGVCLTLLNHAAAVACCSRSTDPAAVRAPVSCRTLKANFANRVKN